LAGENLKLKILFIMSIVFSAIVPHPPILIPQIGKENLEKLKSTVNAFEKLKKELEKSKAETILIISPHGLIHDEVFTMNLNPDFNANFENFGDFSTKKTWPGDIGLTYKIREALETKAPLQLVSDPNLDYGTSVPLFLLTSGSEKIIPMYYSGLSNEEHFSFGKMLNRELQIRKEPIAVIASGDLSHTITKDAPAGYNPKGKKFDNKLIELLKNKKAKDLLKLDKELIAGASECGLKSILIQQGIMDGINYEPHLLSYEAPFGVGYLVMNFKM